MESKKILIVEDESLISAGIKTTLGRQGYDCLAVSSGEDAINQVTIIILI
jgi:CheY-like chemotaxis protein